MPTTIIQPNTGPTTIIQPNTGPATTLAASAYPVRLTTIGTRGPQGPQGPTGTGEGGMLPEDYFAIANRFSEIALSPLAQQQARINLDIQVIDGGTF